MAAQDDESRSSCGEAPGSPTRASAPSTGRRHHPPGFVYSGFTFEALARRPEPDLREALALADLLMDGPVVSAVSDGAGEWRGARIQRVLTNRAAGLPSRGLPDADDSARLSCRFASACLPKRVRLPDESHTLSTALTTGAIMDL